MRIAILDTSGSFHDGRVGATHSMMRRLFYPICKSKLADVSYVDIGDSGTGNDAQKHGINWISAKDTKEAFEVIKDNKFDHVVSIYYPASSRLQYNLFRRWFDDDSTKFHQMYFSWPDNWLKRELSVSDSIFAKFNGRVFACSPRLYLKLKKHAGDNAALLLPPVPDSYYLKANKKPLSDKIRISWLGRIDSGKGTNEVVELFRELASDKRYKIKICGFRNNSSDESKKLHDWLKQQSEFEYTDVPFAGHNEQLEQFVGDFFKHTDIYFTPYKKLSSTIDTPLLIQEAMAALSIVISKPFGNLAWLYDNPDFLPADNSEYLNKVKTLINTVDHEKLKSEQKRLANQNKYLACKSSQIVDRFLRLLEFDKKEAAGFPFC